MAKALQVFIGKGRSGPGGLSHGLCIFCPSKLPGTQVLNKYLQNEWLKSNLKEVRWAAWLREIIELWLIRGLGYTQEP